eukprot:563675-Prorocentrum_lima.AAC.1
MQRNRKSKRPWHKVFDGGQDRRGNDEDGLIYIRGQADMALKVQRGIGSNDGKDGSAQQGLGSTWLAF